jgi:hypothetical protein
MNLTNNCNFNLIKSCIYILSGIKELYVTSARNPVFITNDNIIIDILNVEWNKITFADCKVTQAINNGIEQVVMDLDVPYIDSTNKIELKNLTETYYSFLILTKNNEVFFIQDLINSQFVEQYNPNGFTIKEISTAIKSLFQVDYLYYQYITNNLPIAPSDDCALFYDDLALSSTQSNALTIQCLVEDYDGWI